MKWTESCWQDRRRYHTILHRSCGIGHVVVNIAFVGALQKEEVKAAVRAMRGGRI